MRIPVGVRANSATWAAPAVAALLVLYYRVQRQTGLSGFHGYAPAIVSYGFESHYPIAYAVAACLGGWESGRLRRDGVWVSAPLRSRARIAVGALVPVWALAWLTLLLPAAVLLIRAGATPSVSCVPLIAMTMAVTVAYSVIGFTASLVVSHFVAAPVLAAAVWYAVAASWSFSDPMWIRHVLGQYPTTLMFGELPAFSSLASHVLFVGGIATALGLLALLRNRWPVRVAAGVVVAAACTLSSYALVADWGASPPLLRGRAPVSCTGIRPQICLPRVTDGKAEEISADYRAVSRDLARLNVSVDVPRKIVDSILDGRYPQSSTSHVWYLALTGTRDQESMRFQMAHLAAVPRCHHLDRGAEQRIDLWVGGLTRTRNAALRRERQEAFTPAQRRTLEQSARTVVSVEKMPVAAQAAWYVKTRDGACVTSSAVAG